MDGLTLHRLGKRLTDLSADVVRGSEPATYTPGEQAVLARVHRHPGSTVTEVAAATGFVQSHVSASVGRLRDRGLLTAQPDRADGRRLRLELTATARRGVRDRLAIPIEAALVRAVGQADAERTEQVLEDLAALVLP